MGLEAGTYVNDLTTTNPPGTDNILQGDDHIRLIKSVLKTTFPNASKPFRFPVGAAPITADPTLLVTDANEFVQGNASGGAFNITLPTLAAGDAGWYVIIQKSDSSANAVTIVGTINGASNFALATQWQSAMVWWDGDSWQAIVSSPSIAQLSALTAPAAGDLLPIRDVSASVDKQITLENMFKVIPDITAETAIAVDDEVVIYDLSGTAAKSMTILNLAKLVNVLTAETALAAGDFFPVYDTSGSATDKIDAKYVNPFSLQLLHVRDEKASGTNGGTFTSGAWRTRTLNTETTNEITGASLSSNQIVLPAGTYFLEARAPAFAVDEHKAKWRNVTDGTDVLIGSSNYTDNDDDPGHTDSIVRGRFTIAAEKTFELQHQCSASQATTGLGRAVSFSVVEVYAEVMIWKVK